MEKKKWTVFDSKYINYLEKIFINSDGGQIVYNKDKKAFIQNFDKKHNIHKIPYVYKGIQEYGDLMFFDDANFHSVENLDKSTNMYNIRYFKKKLKQPLTASLFCIRTIVGIYNALQGKSHLSIF